jgi:hypothetical protein
MLSEAQRKKLDKYKSPHPVLGPEDKIGEGDSYIVYDVFPSNKEAFDQMKREVIWQHMSHVSGEVPRLVCVQGAIDSEDGSIPVYRHPSDQSPPLLEFTPKVEKIKEEVQKIVGHPMNHVLIQLYRDGKDRIESHSDKTLDIVRGSSIVNVSIGAQRTMRLTTKTADAKRAAATEAEKLLASTVDKKTQLVPMPHGSVFVLGLKTNEAWLHGINADKRRPIERSDVENAFDGQRISLTFRNIATFLTGDETMIWGQGACSKDRLHPEPVVNGNEESNREMINAFGAENQASRFNWEGIYGKGFNVLHIKAPPPSLPLLFLCDNQPENDAVREVIRRASVMVHEIPAAKISDGCPRVCFRNNDKLRHQVYGRNDIELYLSKPQVRKENSMVASLCGVVALA